MAFKLTKDEMKQRDAIADRLRESAAVLETAVGELNAALAEQREKVEGAVSAYNEILNEAREFAQDIASQAESDFSDKSEKWQEGDRGQIAQAWHDEWEGLELDDVELQIPDDMQFDMNDHAEILQNATEEAEF